MINTDIENEIENETDKIRSTYSLSEKVVEKLENSWYQIRKLSGLNVSKSEIVEMCINWGVYCFKEKCNDNFFEKNDLNKLDTSEIAELSFGYKHTFFHKSSIDDLIGNLQIKVNSTFITISDSISKKIKEIWEEKRKEEANYSYQMFVEEAITDFFRKYELEKTRKKIQRADRYIKIDYNNIYASGDIEGCIEKYQEAILILQGKSIAKAHEIVTTGRED